MRRANILFEGPPSGSKYCEGCDLWDTTCADGDHCPIFGDVYQETEEPNRGLRCRPDECLGNERTVRAGIVTADVRFQHWVASPVRDKIKP